jgi:hypothetical protein
MSVNVPDLPAASLHLVQPPQQTQSTALSDIPPGARLKPDAFEMLLEALLQIRLECHLWKAEFIHIMGHSFPQDPTNEFHDVWDLMLARAIPRYSEENYALFTPLFDTALKEARARLEKLSVVYARFLPRHVQKRLAKAIRQLEFSVASYRWIPARASSDDPDVLFSARFKAVIRLLRLVAHDADERLSAMVPENS